MRLISAVLCSAVAVGAYLALPAVASATDVHCSSDNGADITIIDGRTACRAASDAIGRARAAGYDGVGYASATLGAYALGVGISGGVGASDGEGGTPIAIGIGPDAVAISSISSTGHSRSDQLTATSGHEPDVRHHVGIGANFAVTIALDGSRALVSSAEATVTCLGAGAVAWDAGTGKACLATPFGTWQTA
ncbi:DUF6764 family protein [Nocardia sp. NPDC052566]|uniref:DUF6764 family protein n=1 Tax=Nocardia sp. NPDC052566 TaxID=3364330 RepID=UPI0037C98076